MSGSPLTWGRIQCAIAAAAIALAGWSPFLAEHPEVAEGNRRLEAGDAEGALRSYDRAERALGRRPEIDYDRGGALYRMGRFAEARDAYRKALDAPGLAAADSYNLGDALAHTEEIDGAIRAFRRALALDPGNEDARYNLEVMLRRRDEKKEKPPPQAQPPPRAGSGEPQGGDGGGARDGGQPDAGAGGGPRREAGRDRDSGQAGRAGSDPPRREAPDGRRADGGRATSLSRQQAERILDAMRERERNMPMRPAERRRQRETHAEKDW